MHEQNSELYTYLTQILSNSIDKCIISHPKSKSELYKKIAIHKKNTYFLILGKLSFQKVSVLLEFLL